MTSDFTERTRAIVAIRRARCGGWGTTTWAPSTCCWDSLRTERAWWMSFVTCYPNAGLPDEEGHYHETPESLSRS